MVCFNENKAENILKFLEKNVEIKLENQEVITSLSDNKGKRNKNGSNDNNILPSKIKYIDEGNNNYKKYF